MLRRTFFALYYTKLLGFIMLSDRKLAGFIPLLRGCMPKSLYIMKKTLRLLYLGVFVFYKDGLPHFVHDSPCAI